MVPLGSGASGEIAGFFSVKAEGQWTTGLPDEVTPRYVPVVEIAFLARHRLYRRTGLGDVLLIRSFRVTVEVADLIGIAGIYLASTSEGLPLYERHGFARLDNAGRRLFLPIQEARDAIARIDRG